ncbi:M14 family metallopeptidase [Pseudalkalibacillus caeni]|uniref:LysM peptidoglycan-binding domain-containing protein n=1 Tax=Exobacillus caeni TaxID=2574798 RepID=A0A5R9F1N4_9BACL|nr:M14 family metallopeptidase [Pseudalkalibacillus caeni]TLS36326.1 LysM peptidoglycan-binding domain-containing protein [Pseudalkalibacillus caeni]
MKVRVRPGDTLWHYSQLFQVPLRLILDSNPEINAEQLMIGEEVNIPGFVRNMYKISAGESLWSIANKTGYPLDSLFLLNQSIKPQFLQIGQEIYLPLRVTWLLVDPKQEYTYEIMVNDIRKLVTVYPFIRSGSIGESVMGKPIPEIRVGQGEKKVHFNGSFHANEWLATPLLMKFLNVYLFNLTSNKPIRGLQLPPLYDSTMLSVVPMVNPDGVNLVINGPPEETFYKELVLEINNAGTDFKRWKANIRGVDLNNQFPAKWDVEAARKPEKPSPKNYPGKAPLTEPETIAMADLTRRRDFDRVLAFHSQGEEIYWGYEGLEPPESRTLAEEFSRVSGYKAIRYVDSYAGYKDWFIQEWRRPGFTIEIGLGESPLPLTQFDEIYEENLGIMLASLYV